MTSWPRSRTALPAPLPVRSDGGEADSIRQDFPGLRVLLNCAAAGLRGYLCDIVGKPDGQAAYDALNTEDPAPG